jgi:hypothetical protein
MADGEMADGEMADGGSECLAENGLTAVDPRDTVAAKVRTNVA